MTEEQKQALIEYCEDVISAHVQHGGDSDEEQVFRIALAALTAPPIKVDDSMALAFHKALNDGGVGHEDLEEIKVGLEAALCNLPRPAPAADMAALVPEKASMADYYENVRSGEIDPEEAGIAMWDACRAAILRNIEEKQAGEKI